MIDHTHNAALLAALHAVEARIEAPASSEIAWEPDPDLLRDLLLERKLDREIERRAAPLPQPSSQQTNGGTSAGGEEPDLQGNGQLRHDKAMASTFLTYLDPTATRFTFQTFDDNKDRKSKALARVLHGTLDACFAELTHLNNLGAGIFITVNETNFLGRSAKNIVRPRALFHDADGDEQVTRATTVIEAHDAIPSMTVSSGGGRHGYYICDDIPLDQFSALQKSLAAKLGTDPAVHDLPRVMRLPGMLHLKDPSKPRLVKLVATDGAVRRWKLSDLIDRLGLSTTTSDRTSGGHKIAEAFRRLDPNQRLAEGIEYPAADIEEIRSAALAIPPTVITDEPNWMSFARALAWQAKQRPDDMEVLWEILDTVSRQAPKYNKDDNRAKFDRYIDEAGTGVKTNTIATLFFLAREHGWRGGPWEQERRARQVAENIKIGDDVTEPLLPQIMTLEEMRMRLVFVGSNGVVADTITGRVRKKEHAADEYAASQHTYTLQNGTPKKGPALKFWIASKDRITVEVLAWVPGAGVICQPPEGPGPAFNMWRGLTPIAFPEDWQTRVEPFLEHVEFLVPIEEERERFLQWLAHIVRAPEVLPHTAYLMTTPTTGIGRNWMASVLVRVLRGYVAAGISLPELLDGGFTGRLSMKLLAIVDEAREGSGERRYQRATRLTSLLTEEHRHVNHKYGYQSVEKNCGRWLMFSNRDDAIPFDNSDRRIIVIANPTTRKEDVYYERLYGLPGDKDFIGSVRHWLETRDIAAFRPGEHAPMNQIKLRVLNEMMSETERAVAEFKEDCRTGLTSRDAIKDHVDNTITGNGSKFANVNDTHLTHAISRAGMLNTGRRVIAYQKNYHGGVVKTRFTVVIVRGEWTTEIVKKADPRKLLEAMGIKEWSTTKPQR